MEFKTFKRRLPFLLKKSLLECQFKFIDKEMKNVFDDMNEIINHAQESKHNDDFVRNLKVLNLLLECQTCLFEFQDQLLILDSLQEELKKNKKNGSSI